MAYKKRMLAASAVLMVGVGLVILFFSLSRFDERRRLRRGEDAFVDQEIARGTNIMPLMMAGLSSPDLRVQAAWQNNLDRLWDRLTPEERSQACAKVLHAHIAIETNNAGKPDARLHIDWPLRLGLLLDARLCKIKVDGVAQDLKHWSSWTAGPLSGSSSIGLPVVFPAGAPSGSHLLSLEGAIDVTKKSLSNPDADVGIQVVSGFWNEELDAKNTHNKQGLQTVTALEKRRSN